MVSNYRLDWDRWGIKQDHHKLFLLRWEELFSDQTAETWQTRSLSLPDFFRELLEVANVADDHDARRRDISNILLELESRVGRDRVAMHDYPLLSIYISEIKKQKGDLQVVRSIAQIASEYVSGYGEKVTGRLLELLESDDTSRKDDIYSLALSFGSYAAAQGCSTKYLQESLQLLKEPSQSFTDRVNSLCSAINRAPQLYKVEFAVKWLGPMEPISLASAEIQFSREGDTNGLLPRSIPDSDPNEINAVVTVCAIDQDAAVQAAIRVISDASAVVRFYKHRSGSLVKGGDAYVVSEEGKNFKVPIIDQKPPYFRNANEFHGVFSRTLNVLGNLNESDRDQCLAALHYHELAISAETEEGRLINLWIALEAITRHGTGSNIGRICRYLPASLALNNTGRILTQLAVDIRHMWRKEDSPQFLAHCPSSTPTRLHPRDLLTALLDEKEGEKIESLYELIAENCLIRHRIHRYRSGALKDTKEVGKMIEANRSNVEWQLRRIYRARNDFIHRGRSIFMGRNLVRHLHMYFCSFLNRLFWALHHHPEWSLRSAMEHQTVLYEIMLHQAKKGLLTREAVVHPHLLEESTTPGTPWSCSE